MKNTLNTFFKLIACLSILLFFGCSNSKENKEKKQTKILLQHEKIKVERIKKLDPRNIDQVQLLYIGESDKPFLSFYICSQKSNSCLSRKEDMFNYPFEAHVQTSNSLFEKLLKMLDSEKTRTLLDNNHEQGAYILKLIHKGEEATFGALDMDNSIILLNNIRKEIGSIPIKKRPKVLKEFDSQIANTLSRLT